MKKELEYLQKALDALKLKYENSVKQEFEVGKWYKYTNSSRHLVCFTTNKGLAYGFDLGGYNGKIQKWDTTDLTPATPKEVEEALTKEAVKKYDDKTVLNLITDKDVNPHKQSKLSLDRFYYQPKANKLYHSVTSNWSILIFDNGTWAQIIKEPKTIDEIASEINYTTKNKVIDYLAENKSEIIETLKNLE